MSGRENAIDEYLKTLHGDEKEWNETFIHYMREHYPALQEVISFKMPTYKLGSGKERNYIAFGFGKKHFSLHSMDFEYIAALKQKLSKPGKGKGCVNVPFSQTNEKEILFRAIDDIVHRSAMVKSR